MPNLPGRQTNALRHTTAPQLTIEQPIAPTGDGIARPGLLGSRRARPRTLLISLLASALLLLAAAGAGQAQAKEATFDYSGAIGKSDSYGCTTGPNSYCYGIRAPKAHRGSTPR